MTDVKTITSRDLARLWSEAAALVSHSASCGCGGGHVVGIDAGMVAADILDYLAAKYHDGGHTDLAAYIEARADSAAATFANWLEDLDDAPLAPDDLARLEADLATALDSMRNHRG